MHLALPCASYENVCRFHHDQKPKPNGGDGYPRAVTPRLKTVVKYAVCR